MLHHGSISSSSVSAFAGFTLSCVFRKIGLKLNDFETVTHCRGAAWLERAISLFRARDWAGKEDAKIIEDRIERPIRLGKPLAVLDAQVFHLGYEREIHGNNSFEGLHQRWHDISGQKTSAKG